MNTDPHDQALTEAVAAVIDVLRQLDPDQDPLERLESASTAIATAMKATELKTLPHGDLGGRRLQLGGKDGPLDNQASWTALKPLFDDLGKRLGPTFMRVTPAVVIEQFCIQSVIRNEDTAGLLVSLLNSFMLAYLTPELSERAFQHLVGLEGLRQELAQLRSQGTRH